MEKSAIKRTKKENLHNGGITEHGQSHFTPKWVKTIGAGLKIQWQRPICPSRAYP